MGTRFSESRRGHLQGLWRALVRQVPKEDLAAAISAAAGVRLGVRVIEKALQEDGPPISLRTQSALDHALEQIADRQLGLDPRPVQFQPSLICPDDPLHAHGAALLHYQRSHFRAAIGWADRCISLCRARRGGHYHGCEAAALRLKASAHAFLHELARARDSIAAAAALSEACDDPADQAVAYAGWGWIELQEASAESLARSEQMYGRALQRSPGCAASYHHGLGHILLHRRRPRIALRHFEAGLAAYGDNLMGQANCDYGKARALHAQGRLEEALRLLCAADDRYAGLGNELGQALCKLHRLPLVLLLEPGRTPAARALCQEAQVLFRRSGDLRHAQECAAWQARYC